MSITFNAQWVPNGVPTNVSTATIGIFDATTQTQIVANGTTMTNTATGAYSYDYSSEVTGHLYLGTMVLTATNGAVGNFEQAIYATGSNTAPAGPVTSSSQMVGLLQQQLGDITAAKTAAIMAITTTLSIGAGATYSISGHTGSESLDMAGFLRLMQDQVKTFTELELTLNQSLQDLQPFDIHQCVGGYRRGGWC